MEGDLFAKNKGGLKFTSWFDVSKPLSAKLWWILKSRKHCEQTLYGRTRREFTNLETYAPG